MRRLSISMVTTLWMVTVLLLFGGCERVKVDMLIPTNEDVFFTLSLGAIDDTGLDAKDGYTNLGDDGFVVFILENTNGFNSGDTVSMYRNKNSEDILAWGTIGREWYQINAESSKSFIVPIPKFEFAEGTFTLHAEYKSKTSEEVIISPLIVITYDVSAPVVHITEPDIDPAQKGKSLYAVDTDSGYTFWSYRQVNSSVICDELLFPLNSHAYTEGTELIFNQELDNDTKICFAVSDLAGNISYAESQIIVGITQAESQ